MDVFEILRDSATLAAALLTALAGFRFTRPQRQRHPLLAKLLGKELVLFGGIAASVILAFVFNVGHRFLETERQLIRVPKERPKGFLAFPLRCGAPLIRGRCENSHKYRDGPYSADIMISVLDHSMVPNPRIFGNAYQYGECIAGSYPRCNGDGGGDGKIVAFNGEIADGTPSSADKTCVQGHIKLKLDQPLVGMMVRQDPNGGCSFAGFGFVSGDEHPGYDYYAEMYTPVFAAAEGIVVNNGDKTSDAAARCVNTNLPGDCAGSNFVGIDHQNGYISQYGHLSSVSKDVKPGEEVTQGQLIGRSGCSGLPKCTGNQRFQNARLHFEVITLVPHGEYNHYPSKRALVYNPLNWAVVDPYGWVGRPGADPLYSFTRYNIEPMNLWQP